MPLYDPNYVATGNGRMIGRYQSAPVVAGINKALMLRCQELENELFDFLYLMQLKNHPVSPTAPGLSGNLGLAAPAFLDQLGALVGEPRSGRTDADFLAHILIAIRANRSRGRAEDIIQITALITTVAAYYQWPPAAWEVDIPWTANVGSVVAALREYLGKAQPAGVAGRIVYQAFNVPLVTWASAHGGAAGQGFTSQYGGTGLYELAGLAEAS